MNAFVDTRKNSIQFAYSRYLNHTQVSCGRLPEQRHHGTRSRIGDERSGRRLDIGWTSGHRPRKPGPMAAWQEFP